MAWVWSFYAALVALLVSVFLALPESRPVVEVGLGLAAIGAVEFGLRRFRPQRAGAWRCLQLALALLAAGDAVLALEAMSSPIVTPHAELSKVFYLALYPVLAIALLWLGRSASRYRDDTTMTDTVVLTLSGGLIVWIILVRPYLLRTELSTAGRFAAVGAWIGYVTVLAASLGVLRSRRRNRPAALLAVAVFAFLVAEIFYGYELTQGHTGGRGLVDLGYVTFTALCGAAALHPSMREIPASGLARQTLSPWRVTTIVVALVSGPTVLLVEASRGVAQPGVSIAIIGGLVGLLMLFRLRLTGRAYQRRAAREHASRAASEAMVAARTQHDIISGIRSALRPVLRPDASNEVELVDPYLHEVRDGTVEPVGRAERATHAVRLARSDAALIFAAPAEDLDDLNGLLQSLADQAAVALERIRLAEAAGAAERERHFRTLVLASSDVILISRDGRIDYATPSAQTLFGRDVQGEAIDDVVHPDGSAELGPTHVDAREDGPVRPDNAESGEATVRRNDTELTVLVHRRDLSDEPTVRGVVTTLRDVTAERALQRDLAYRANHDELTGLANVRAWEECLMAAEGDRQRGPGHGAAILVIDLDNFKGVNDRYGHAAGDALLAEVARRIQDCLRPGDFAARVGGDEFAALLRGPSTVEDARAVAQRLIEALSRPAIVTSMMLDCGASVGLSYSEGAEPTHLLVRQADTALYAAKEEGRGRWREYNGTPSAPSGPMTAGT